jgi:hypothetical protein
MSQQEYQIDEDVVREMYNMRLTGYKLYQIGQKFGLMSDIVRKVTDEYSINCNSMNIFSTNPRSKNSLRGSPVNRYERAKNMYLLRKQGKTLGYIAKQYGLTRERVRQIINKYRKLTESDL